MHGKHLVFCLYAGREQRHRVRRAGCCDSTFSAGDRCTWDPSWGGALIMRKNIETKMFLVSFPPNTWGQIGKKYIQYIHWFFDSLIYSFSFFCLVDSVEVSWSMYLWYVISHGSKYFLNTFQSFLHDTYDFLSQTHRCATEVYGEMPKQDLDAALKRFKESWLICYTGTCKGRRMDCGPCLFLPPSGCHV